MTQHNTLYTDTPEITVFNNQGQPIRRLDYYRAAVDDLAEERIQRAAYDTLGQISSQVDARFMDTTCLNVQYQHDLTGDLIGLDSMDAGDHLVIYDVEGRPCWQRDACGTEQYYTYDELGRLLTCTEQTATEDSTVTEQRIYGEQQADATAYNLRGALSRHYDTAGLVDWQDAGYDLQGQPLQEQRQLLPVNTAPDWSGTDEATWQADLETTCYLTCWQYDALAQLLWQQDAAGHQRRYAQDVQSRLQASWVTPQEGTEQALWTAISYTAAGDKQQMTGANGAQVDYTYTPENQWLLQIRVQTDGTLLQQWDYTYDPTGNLLTQTDGSNTTWDYTYDSLYQLTQATGQENTNADPANDNPTALTSLDTVAYTRAYTYDKSGNPAQMDHQGATDYTRTLIISDTSNQAILASEDVTAADVPDYFDANGSQQTLHTGETLSWNPRNQLGGLSNADVTETYTYDAAGQRIRKVRCQTSAEVEQVETTLYLPGLILHQVTQDGITQESFARICVGEPDDNPVQLIHWTTGKPDAMTNDEIRYSLQDISASGWLELDTDGNLLTQEAYYPNGGTAIRIAASQDEADYKLLRYTGEERDAEGLYHAASDSYQPVTGRGINISPDHIAENINPYSR